MFLSNNCISILVVILCQLCSNTGQIIEYGYFQISFNTCIFFISKDKVTLQPTKTGKLEYFLPKSVQAIALIRITSEDRAENVNPSFTKPVLKVCMEPTTTQGNYTIRFNFIQIQ